MNDYNTYDCVHSRSGIDDIIREKWPELAHLSLAECLAMFDRAKEAAGGNLPASEMPKSRSERAARISDALTVEANRLLEGVKA